MVLPWVSPVYIFVPSEGWAVMYRDDRGSCQTLTLPLTVREGPAVRRSASSERAHWAALGQQPPREGARDPARSLVVSRQSCVPERRGRHRAVGFGSLPRGESSVVRRSWPLKEEAGTALHWAVRYGSTTHRSYRLVCLKADKTMMSTVPLTSQALVWQLSAFRARTVLWAQDPQA